MFDLKNTEGLSFMTLKSDGKFEEKLTCGLENDEKSHFPNQKSKVSKIFTLMGSFCANYVLFELKQ